MSYSNGKYAEGTAEYGILRAIREEGIVAAVETFRERSTIDPDLSDNGFVPELLEALVRTSCSTMRREWNENPLRGINEIYSIAQILQRPPPKFTRKVPTPENLNH